MLYVVIVVLLVIICGNIYYMHKQEKITNHYKNVVRNNNYIMKVFSRWMILEAQGKQVADFLAEYEYKRVAIYGLGYLGKTLYYNLKSAGVDVVYGVDKNEGIQIDGLTIYHSCTVAEKVDVIIVTALLACYQVEHEYGDNLPGVLISLEDIIDEM